MLAAGEKTRLSRVTVTNLVITVRLTFHLHCLAPLTCLEFAEIMAQWPMVFAQTAHAASGPGWVVLPPPFDERRDGGAAHVLRGRARAAAG